MAGRGCLGFRLRAVVLAADRQGRNFVGGLTDEKIASTLCSAVGHWGSGAEYLMETVDPLERLGIRDADLWRLQRLVAQRLSTLQGTGA
jgi:glutathione-specific gamma-glutamylcyclotransferase